jgi:D-sedoheptulose 7-phosphate isomerase
MSHIDTYCRDAISILKKVDKTQIEKVIRILLGIRSKKGRVFFLGVGGSAGNCSHAVNDFRKICGIEAYAVSDNVSELTARTNDEGWHTVFAEWLKTSRIGKNDAVFVLSVGGGDKEKNISANIVYGLEHARKVKARILGIVGRDGGYTKKVADGCVIIPPFNVNTITAHTESFQAVIWHLIVSDPRMMKVKNKWESTEVFKKYRSR